MEHNCPRQERIIYFDYLRILATLAVIVMHTTASSWYAAGVSTPEWLTMTVYESLVRWPVAMFVMLTGALFLGTERSLSTLWGKHILRIVTAFLFWSAVYAVKAYRYDGCSQQEALEQFLRGHFHLWYLPFICGIYAIMPFLYQIVKSRKLIVYFLVMAAIFGNLLPRLTELAELLSPLWGPVARTLMGRVKIYFFMGHMLYLVLGYFLATADIPRLWRRVIYLGGLVGLAFTLVPTVVLSRWKSYAVQIFLDPASLQIAMTAAALFVFARYHLNGRSSLLLRVLSKLSFGAYLVHALVIECLDQFLGVNVMLFPPKIGVPAVSLLVAVISFGISGVFHLLPIAKKYIV